MYITEHDMLMTFVTFLSCVPDFGCDESLGFVFDECGPVCPRTCENYDTPIGDLKTKCFKPCIASCQCPADKVLLNGRCVAFDECPRIDRGDIPVGPAQG